jgi:hypothetical protein
MTTATTPDLTPETGEEEAVAQEAQEFLQLAAAYRSLNRAQRRRIAGSASPETRKVLANLERDMAIERSPGSMSAILTDGKEKQAPHLDLIDRVFRDIARGHSRKVLITMPPRHGKSRRAARWAPLWYLLPHPGHRVMIASYSADLADDHGRWIRDAIVSYGDQIGLHLHAGSKAANRFDLADADGNRLEGGLVTAGVGGGLTGKGAHLAVVDDPIKDAADAESPTMRGRCGTGGPPSSTPASSPAAPSSSSKRAGTKQDLAGKILEGETPPTGPASTCPPSATPKTTPSDRKPGRPCGPCATDAKPSRRSAARSGNASGGPSTMQKPRPLEGGVWKWPWITDNRITPWRSAVSTSPASWSPSTRPAGRATPTTRPASSAPPAPPKARCTSWTTAPRTWAPTPGARSLPPRHRTPSRRVRRGGQLRRRPVRADHHPGLARPRPRGQTKRPADAAIIEVHAKQGKRLRAESPIAQLYSRGLVHHVGEHTELEGQMVTWIPGMDSPGPHGRLRPRPHRTRRPGAGRPRHPALQRPAPPRPPIAGGTRPSRHRPYPDH